MQRGQMSRDPRARACFVRPMIDRKIKRRRRLTESSVPRSPIWFLRATKGKPVIQHEVERLWKRVSFLKQARFICSNYSVATLGGEQTDGRECVAQCGLRIGSVAGRARAYERYFSCRSREKKNTQKLGGTRISMVGPFCDRVCKGGGQFSLRLGKIHD